MMTCKTFKNHISSTGALLEQYVQATKNATIQAMQYYGGYAVRVKNNATLHSHAYKLHEDAYLEVNWRL
jgi:hypothetical protein